MISRHRARSPTSARAAAARKGPPPARLPRNPTFVAGVRSILGIVVLVAPFADLLFPGDPQDMVGAPVLWPGRTQFPLGTDSLGRDVLAAAGAARAPRCWSASRRGDRAMPSAWWSGVAGFFGGWVDTC